jgi:hypothetical protein
LSWCDVHVRSRFATGLHFDLALRGGEGAKVVQYGLESTSEYLRGNLFDTKTYHGVLYPWSIRHTCEEYCEEWCTPCLFDMFWLRFGHLPAVLDVDVRSPDEVEKMKPPILTCGLLLSLHPAKDTGLHKALGKDRSSKIVKHTLIAAGIDEAWTVHKTRGMTTSKVVNMGLVWGSATIRGRWSPNSRTFEKSYFRKTTFLEATPLNAVKTFEVVLRLKETILSLPFSNCRSLSIPRGGFVAVLS